MKISGRNQLKAVVREVVKGEVMAKVVLDYKGERIVSVVTVDSIEELNIKPGDNIIALIKSTSVMLAKE